MVSSRFQTFIIRVKVRACLYIYFALQPHHGVIVLWSEVGFEELIRVRVWSSCVTDCDVKLVCILKETCKVMRTTRPARLLRCCGAHQTSNQHKVLLLLTGNWRSSFYLYKRAAYQEHETYTRNYTGVRRSVN